MTTIKTLITPEEKTILKKCEKLDGFSLFNSEIVNHRIYIVATNDAGEIVGMAQLIETSSKVANAIGVGFVETHEQHRNKGISKMIVAEIFQLARNLGKDIANTAYDPDGERWLRRTMEHHATMNSDVMLFEAGHHSSHSIRRPSI